MGRELGEKFLPRDSLFIVHGNVLKLESMAQDKRSCDVTVRSVARKFVTENVDPCLPSWTSLLSRSKADASHCLAAYEIIVAAVVLD